MGGEVRGGTLGRLAAIILVLIALLLVHPAVAAQESPNRCPVGERPSFPERFAPLEGWIGGVLGRPLTCAHPDPAGTGDLHVLTTEGLAYWRRSTGTLHFTANYGSGQKHWALGGRGLVGWLGEGVDPPVDAVDLTGCREEFADFRLFEGDPTPYLWSGSFRVFGPFGGATLVGCPASRPRDRYGVMCFLLDGQPVPIGGRSPCTSYALIQQQADGTLLTRLSLGCCVDSVAYMQFTGTGFEELEFFDSCKGHPPRRIPEAWSRRVVEFCGYRS